MLNDTTPSRSFAPVHFTTRYPALDGLRALAISLVFVAHFGGGLHGNLLMRFIGHLRERGWIGVDLFFVLSGFLITGILHDTRQDPNYFRNFYARRALRIFPVYYGTALALLALTPIFRWQWRPVQAWFLLYLGNVPATRDFSLYVAASGRSGALSLFFGHIWSLCVEEQFYLLWPLLVWLAGTRRRILALAVLILSLELAARGWVVLHRSYADAQNLMFRNLLFRADTLMFGAVLAMLLRGPRASSWQSCCKWVFVGTLTLLLTLTTVFPDPTAPWLLSLGLTLVALMCAGLIGAVLDSRSGWAKLFSAPALRNFGKCSYGFYLFHLLFLNLWYWLVAVLASVLHSLALSAALVMSLNFTMNFGLAHFSYQRLERPLLRRKRNWTYQAETRTSST